jgi:hypothetical protein
MVLVFVEKCLNVLGWGPGAVCFSIPFWFSNLDAQHVTLDACNGVLVNFVSAH